MNLIDVGKKAIENGLPSIGKLFLGSAGEKVGEFVAGVLGCDPTPEALEAKLNDPQAIIELKKIESENAKDIRSIELQTIKEENAQINKYEGTANELKSIRFFGPLIIFLRAAFRPIFSYFTGYTLYMNFSGQWDMSEQQVKLLAAYSLIVLVAFFGERAVKNVLPLIMAYFGGKK